jgi:hypothetical protein
MLFIMPFSRDALFVGREDILNAIDKYNVSIDTHVRVALTGLGGVGSVALHMGRAVTNPGIESPRLPSNMRIDIEKQCKTLKLSGFMPAML